jgi:Flp pilus assembly protein TadD
VARALRPETAHELAHLLERTGRGDEAEAVFRDLVDRRRDNARHLTCFGECLIKCGQADEARAVLDHAVVAARAALKLRPDDALARTSLGLALLDQGKLADAEAEYRAVLKLKPDWAGVHLNLGTALAGQGRLADAEAEFRAALKLQPDDDDAHFNLGVTLARQGKLADAEAEHRAALKLKPDYVEAHINLGKALYGQGKLSDAEAELRAALGLKPDLAEAHCNLGHILREAGRYTEALEELRRGHELGSRRPDWRYPSAQWVRECERLAALDARLPAVLTGDDHPADVAERLAFAQLCYDRKLHAAAARLWAEALQADPKLADDRRAQHAYNAACAAALAGCGQGQDDPPPDAAARAKLRGQALGWLKDELAAWSKLLDDAQPKARATVRPVLDHWKADPDLAGLRDEAELAKLPEEERRAWRALWEDVGTLLKKTQADHP